MYVKFAEKPFAYSQLLSQGLRNSKKRVNQDQEHEQQFATK